MEQSPLCKVSGTGIFISLSERARSGVDWHEVHQLHTVRFYCKRVVQRDPRISRRRCDYLEVQVRLKHPEDLDLYHLFYTDKTGQDVRSGEWNKLEAVSDPKQ